MPLLELMRHSPAAVGQFTIEQAVAMSGDGIIRDGTTFSQELREYLKRIPNTKLFGHVDYCLTKSFNNSEFILKDILNELGKRLGYEVENGLYRGNNHSINFDGLWRRPSEHDIIVEVITIDTYRFNLDTVAGYRKSLIQNSKFSEKSSILLVVGQQDTQDLESQVRGSRHAWNTRIVSAESLIKLVNIKEKTGEENALASIRSLLMPFEYTRIDEIIDIIFTLTQGARPFPSLNPSDDFPDIPKPNGKTVRNRTPSQAINELRHRIIKALSNSLAINFVAHKQALFWTLDQRTRVSCVISKRYEGGYNYWYSYQSLQDKFLVEGEIGYYVLGCIDKQVAYAIPYPFITSQLPNLNTTIRDSAMYWHIKLEDSKERGMLLILQGQGKRLSLDEFKINLDGIPCP